MSLDENQVAYFNTAIATAAYAVTRKPKFRGFVDNSDVQNHLWEFVLRHSKYHEGSDRVPKFVRYREENEDEDYDRLIGFVLYDEASIFSRKEKAAAMGYSTADEFYYAKATIEELLTVMFDRDAWLNPPTEHGNERNTKALNEGNNWLATLSDLSNAYGRLDDKDRQVLTLVFKHDIARTKLADMWQLSRKGVDHRIEASIKRLWSSLGGPKWLAPEERERPAGAVGNRRVISNAQARAISDNQYEVGV